MGIVIKRIETEEEIRGKAYVHWKAWQEAYPGMISVRILPHPIQTRQFAKRSVGQGNVVSRIVPDVSRRNVTGKSRSRHERNVQRIAEYRVFFMCYDSYRNTHPFSMPLFYV